MTQLKLEFSYKSFLNFTDRESYLTFRRAWKADYLGKIAEIRQAKLDLKADQRTNPHSSHYTQRRALIQARLDIMEMLGDKRRAAEEAQRQYLAARASAVTGSQTT